MTMIIECVDFCPLCGVFISRVLSRINAHTIDFHLKAYYVNLLHLITINEPSVVFCLHGFTRVLFGSLSPQRI